MKFKLIYIISLILAIYPNYCASCGYSDRAYGQFCSDFPPPQESDQDLTTVMSSSNGGCAYCAYYKLIKKIIGSILLIIFGILNVGAIYNLFKFINYKTDIIVDNPRNLRRLKYNYPQLDFFAMKKFIENIKTSFSLFSIIFLIPLSSLIVCAILRINPFSLNLNPTGSEVGVNMQFAEVAALHTSHEGGIRHFMPGTLLQPGAEMGMPESSALRRLRVASFNIGEDRRRAAPPPPHYQY